MDNPAVMQQLKENLLKDKILCETTEKSSLFREYLAVSETYENTNTWLSCIIIDVVSLWVTALLTLEP